MRKRPEGSRASRLRLSEGQLADGSWRLLNLLRPLQGDGPVSSWPERAKSARVGEGLAPGRPGLSFRFHGVCTNNSWFP